MEGFFRNTLGPGAWALLALVALAIFALYFLKLKRQPLEVPSTLLWHRVVEDLHVNSLWQRLRQNLLLFLQLLMIGLVMLSLLRPGWQGEALEGERFIFLVDNSASMSATDLPSGKTRLEEAKETVASLVDQLDSRMSAMIISFADRPTVVQEFTNNRRRLKESLDTIEPTPSTTDLAGALKLAEGFANPTIASEDVDVVESELEGALTFDEVQLYIVSDGRFREVPEFSLGNLRPVYLPIGTVNAQNLAITAFNIEARESRMGRQRAFLQISNFSEATESVEVQLTLNDEILDAARLEVAPGEPAGSTFRLPGTAEGVLEARLLVPESFDDHLSVDNRALAILQQSTEARVLLVTPGNSSLEAALSTDRANIIATVQKLSPGALETADYLRAAQNQQYDLIIFDQCAPEEMPQANTVFVGRVPPADPWQESVEDEKLAGPQILDWDRNHPLLNLIELGNVQIAESLTVNAPPGGRVLLESTRGALMAIAPRDRFEDLVLGFEIIGRNESGQASFNTDWPRKHSFPSFWLNVLEYFSREHDDAGAAIQAGQLVELRLGDPEQAYELELPDGSRRRLVSDRNGRLVIQETDQLGVYQLRRGGEVVERFAANLFSQEESDIALRSSGDSDLEEAAVDSLTIGYVDVAAQLPGTSVRKEIWKLVLLVALVVLVLEWYIYNRRTYV